MSKFLREKFKKGLAIVVAFAMLITLAPITTIAATDSNPDVYTVTVKDKDGVAVEDVSVSVIETTNGAQVYAGQTNENGEVAISGFADGSIQLTSGTEYKITCTKEGYVSDEKSITVQEIDTSNIDVTLYKSGSISGTLTDAEGEVLANKTVTYSAADIEKTTTTNELGEYSFVNLPIYDDAKLIVVSDNEGYADIEEIVAFDDTGVISDFSLQFTYVKYEITFVPNAFGSFYDKDGNEFVDNKTQVNYGETLEFKFVPTAGYSAILFDGTNELVGNENVYLISDVKSNYEITAITEDDEAPTISNPDVSNQDTWETEKNITYVVSDNAGDAQVQVFISTSNYENYEALEAADDKIEASANSYTVSSSGTYYIYAVDANKNFSKTSVEVEKIDTTSPVVNGVSKSEADGNITYVVDVSDEGSGILAVTYSKNENGTDATEIIMVDGVYSFTVQDNDTYYVFVEDQAGNIGTDSIDVIAPTITTPTVGNTWGTTINVSFTASDNVGVEHVYYHISSDFTATDKVEILADEITGVYSFEVGSNGYYFIFAVDKMGNYNIVEAVVEYVDVTAPSIDSITKNPDSVWANSAIEVGVVASDAQSGVVKVLYGTSENAYLDENCSVAVLEAGQYVFTIPETVSQATYYVWAVDSVGNISDAKTFEVKFDKTAPENVSMKYVEETNKGWVQKVVNVLTFGQLFKEAIYIEVQATDAGSGIAEHQYQMVADGGSLADDKWVTPSEDDLTFNEDSVEIKLDIEENENFSGKVYVRVYDNVGNYCEAISDTENGTLIVKDNIACLDAPTITATAGDEEYVAGEWSQNDVIIILSGAETLSGISRYQYSTDQINWIDVPETTRTQKQKVDSTEYVYDQLTVTNTSSQKVTYYFRAVSNTNHSSSVSSIEVVIDGEPPVISDVVVKEEWGESVQISFSASDNAGVANVYYQASEDFDSDEKTVLTAVNGTYSFEVTENGTYYLFAVDGGNKRVMESVVVNNVDTTNPTIEAPTKNPEAEWANSELEITVEANDNQTTGTTTGSGVVNVYYSTTGYKADDANTAQYVDGKYVFSTPKTECEGTTYYVWAVDALGHVSECQTIAVNIDLTAPTDVSMNYVKDTEKGWIEKFVNVLTFGLIFKEEVYIEVSAKDNGESGVNSGIAKYQYQMVADGDKLSEDAWIDVDSQEENVEIQLDLEKYEDFLGKVYVRVYDVAGNYCEAVTDTESNGGTTIVKDNSTPAAPIINTNGYVADGEHWTNKVVITLSGADTTSGVANYQYKIDYADDELKDVDWTDMPETTGTLVQKADGTVKVADQITIINDTNATYYFHAISNTGNISAESSVIVQVQETIPENAKVEISDATGENGWHINNPTITIEQPSVDTYAAQVTTYYKLWNTSVGETEESTSEVVFTGNNPTISKDGVYKLIVWTVDEANNRCAEDIIEEIKVDTTTPIDLKIAINDELVNATNGITYDKFYQNEITIKLSANCDVSGLQKIEYQKVTATTEYDENGTWIAYNSTTGIVVEPSDKCIIYMRAVDMAGHSTIINSTGVVVDNQKPVGEASAPEIDILLGAANANGMYKDDVLVQFVVIDPGYIGGNSNANGYYSGLKQVTYRVYTSDTNAEEEGTLMNLGDLTTGVVFDNDNHAKKWTGSITIDADKFNSNNVYVEVTAVDNAGNTRTTTTKAGAIKIDTTAPTIDISYDNNVADNNFYFNEDRTATIVVTERNFNPEDIILTLTNTENVIPKISEWVKAEGSRDGNGDDTTWTATLVYSADGDYTFGIAYTDLAGNVCEDISYGDGVAPTEFTVDRTLPTITVDYDNNNVKNNTFFNDVRIATITITEHNFDIYRVDFVQGARLNGEEIAFPAISWEHNGDVHIATIVYDEDGDYTFDVTVQDMAANNSEAVNYGDSVAPESFTVDQTIEKPSITGIENGMAYKGDVIPVISFSDVNYDSYKVQLVRTRMGEKDVDVTATYISAITENKQGGNSTSNNFATLADNDGIYTLTVTMYDKAGNENTEVVKFTVNRFGSVYEYEESLLGLIGNGGAYVQRVTDDLVIIEYNADKLISDSLVIDITRDGKPLDKVIYEVSPVINDEVAIGDSGWYEYQYTISKENFIVDGVYKVSISSKDATGNSPENSNYEGKSIVFRVDTTKPEITSVIGLEENSYNQDEITVSYTLFDTIGIKSVKILLNGELYEEVTDFSADLNNYNGSFIIKGQNTAQSVQIVVEDLAGNITDTASEEFTSAYTFNASVLVTTDWWAQYINNPWAVGGTVAGVVLIIAAIVFIIIRKNKKANEIA